jgi:glycosyltransferase involved in cell wall biosynthesis
MNVGSTPEPKYAVVQRAKTNVSVVVLAYNEEQELRAAVSSVIDAASAADADVEIIIVNDGSTDGTATIADALEAAYPFVRCVHHPINLGFGAAFSSGIKFATQEWITFFPGDNIVSTVMLREILKHAGQADLVCSFPVNTECRPRLRQILSSAFSFIYKQTFYIHLRSIHTTPAYNVRQLRELHLRSKGYSLPSEIMVKLMRRGCTFMELPGYLNPAKNKSSALRAKHFIEVVSSFWLLILEVFVTQRALYSGVPVRIIPEELRG